MKIYRNNKIYIAGKISGLDVQEYLQNFNNAEFVLQSRYKVINPAKLGRTDKSWWWNMRMCIRLLLPCRSIYMLKNWENSKGAKIEYRIARLTFKKIMYE